MKDQSNSLDSALLKLAAINLPAEQVRRVAVASQGTLHIEIEEGEKQRFFVFEENEISELLVENDSKIPLLSKLRKPDSVTGNAIISYRPGRRIVLGSINATNEIITKAYKKHKSQQAAKSYAIAQAACEQGGFDIPELLRYETQTDSLVMVKRIGKAPVIASDTISTWALIGTCLQQFHTSHGTHDLEEFSARDELLVLDERARRFLLCMPSLPKAWQAGREQLETALTYLPPAILGLTHRDLHDGQFIVAGDTISLLDFDLICHADLALDAGNLLAHMKLRTMQGQQQGAHSAFKDCSKAFLFGLGRQQESGFEHRLYFYQASTFYRLALLYALRPRWSHLTDSLIVEGKRCIDSFNQHRNCS